MKMKDGRNLVARKKRNLKIEKLKRERWSFYKASNYRNSWRARCKKVNGPLEEVPTRPEIQQWIEGQEPYKCYISGDSLNKNTMEADHKDPLSRGGSFKLKNIGITSKRLNRLKGNMKLKEFKQLLKLTSKWEDKGESLFSRLLQSNNVYRRR